MIARVEAEGKLFWLLHKPKNSAIIKVITRGEAEGDISINNSIPLNPIRVLSNAISKIIPWLIYIAECD